MPDQVKDFQYYADTVDRLVGTINDDMATADVAVIVSLAQVYATLATAAPEPAPQRVELHDAACPCITERRQL